MEVALKVFVRSISAPAFKYFVWISLIISGWVIERIRGSHYILGKGNETLVIPVHGKREVPKGTLNNILKKAGFK